MSLTEDTTFDSTVSPRPGTDDNILNRPGPSNQVIDVNSLNRPGPSRPINTPNAPPSHAITSFRLDNLGHEQLLRLLDDKKYERAVVFNRLNNFKEQAIAIDAYTLPLPDVARAVRTVKPMLLEQEAKAAALTEEIQLIELKLRCVDPLEEERVDRQNRAIGEAKNYLDELSSWLATETDGFSRSRSSSGANPDCIQSQLESTPMGVARPPASESIRFRFSFMHTDSLAGEMGDAMNGPLPSQLPPLQPVSVPAPPSQPPAILQPTQNDPLLPSQPLPQPANPPAFTATPAQQAAGDLLDPPNPLSSSGRFSYDRFSLGKKARQVPKFGGDTKKFREWQQLFKVFVDDTPAPTIEKFNLLRTSLIGKAKDAIAHLQWEEGHYELAKQVLTERFGDSKLAQRSHIQELDSLLGKGQISNNQLEAFSDTLCLHVRALTALGLTLTELSTTTTHRVIKCLPLDLRERFITKLAQHRQTDPLATELGFMMTFLETTVRVRREAEWGNDSGAQRDRRRPFSTAPGSNTDSRYRGTRNFNAARSNHSFFAESQAPRQPSRQSQASRQTSSPTARSTSNLRPAPARSANSRPSASPRASPSAPAGSSETPRTSNNGRSCIFCEGPHESFRCREVYTHQERLDKIAAQNGCTKCLKRNHDSRSCRDGPKSPCPNCQGHHYLVMCRKARADAASQRIPTVQTSSNYMMITDGDQLSTDQPEILLQMAVVWLEAGGNRILARVLCDTGSHRSYLASSAAREVKSKPIAAIKTSLTTLGNAVSSLDTHLHRVTLRSRHDPNKAISLNCIETPVISTAEFPEVTHDLGLSPIADAVSGDNCPRTITIIVGAVDLAPIHTGSEKSFGNMLATSSIFGWLFSGTLHGSASPSSPTTNLCELRSSLPTPVEAEPGSIPIALTTRDTGHPKRPRDEELAAALNFLWEGEFMGFDTPTTNEEDSLAREMTNFFKSTTVRLPDGRYELCLPFKDNLENLGSNESLSRARLRSLIQKLRKKPGHLEAVDAEIKKSIDAGFAEAAAAVRRGQPSCYLPLQAVFKYNNDGSILKTRVVKDGSARTSDKAALNDCLHQGSNLLPLIPKVLCAFRECSFPITADIQNAFLQFQLNSSNRTLLRFLWPLGISSDPEAPVKEFWATRLEFGLSCSPWCHIMGVQHHLTISKQLQPGRAEFIQEISDNLYMDDVVIRTNSVEEATDKIATMFEIFQAAHFPLKKWSTTNDTIAAVIREISPVEETEITTGNADAKFLGVRWCQPSDEIGVFTQKALTQLRESTPSKRTLLKGLAQIYDPLGLICPVSIQAKILFQTLWKRNIDWDDPLPQDIVSRYNGFVSSLEKCSDFKVPRALASRFSTARFELHSFCDSSLEAYGCSIFLRTILENRCESHLIVAKARVTPLKNKGSIHRSELLGGLLAAKIATQTRSFLKLEIARTCFWIDNMACVAWIHSKPERWQPFVANRVRAIQQLTHPADWFYIRSAENPSDISSRGSEISSPESRSRWLHGPHWLADPSWKPPKHLVQVTDTDEEQRSPIPHSFLTANYQPDILDEILSPDKFSSWFKLLRAQAYINRLRRYAQACKMAVASRSQTTRRIRPLRRQRNLRSSVRRHYPLEASDFQQAEADLIKRIQAKFFATEIANECKNILSSSPLWQYRPFVDEEGIIRCRSRLENAKDLAYDAKFPIIIPTDGGWARLLILYVHARDCWHWGGVSMTLQHLRSRYFVLKARRIATAALRSCPGCKRLNAKPASEPTPALPAFRIEETSPFFHCGIDFAGPIYYKAENSRRAKGYILFFSCAVTRAVHIELTIDMSTFEVLRGLQKFLHRFPTAKNFYSDNGTSFHRADIEIKLIYANISDGPITDWLSRNGITWTFITPAAPWTGAWWERSIGSVKRCLRKALGTSAPNFRDLEVILSGVEAVVNRRPLTAVSTNPDELHPLTPANLVSGYQGENMIPQSSETPSRKSDIGAVCFSKRWIFQQRILAAFWERYRNEYLVYLRTIMQSKPLAERSIKVDDICLLKDDDKSRAYWPLVRVIEVFKTSSDNKVRSCSIRTASGKTLIRPVKLLYPLRDEKPEPRR